MFSDLDSYRVLRSGGNNRGTATATEHVRVDDVSDETVADIEQLLLRHTSANRPDCQRIARAVVRSSRRYDLDPRLVASILVVESAGNPFAISERKSVGIMQIHLPTWGELADLEDINLFNVEDNVDLGTRILKRYISRFGVWNGVVRYKGGDGPSDTVDGYLEKVRRIYSGNRSVGQPPGS